MIDRRLSVIIVSSPVKSHPSTYLLDTVIESLPFFHGLEGCPVTIVFDGCKLTDAPKFSTKRGKVNQLLYDRYVKYKQAVASKYTGARYTIIELETHHGFALCAKKGLLACGSTYAMIIQHDRIFFREFRHLAKLMDVMDDNESIRYIGFPSVTSHNHDHVLRVNRLANLTTSCTVCCPPFNFCLQPCIFWYDSNHLCHVRRYLEIFSSFSQFFRSPISEILDGHEKQKFHIRTGDFIEDKFGQAQRNLFTKMLPQKQRGDHFDLIVQLAFHNFGSYLLWSQKPEHLCEGLPDVEPNRTHHSSIARPEDFVRHLRGRSMRTNSAHTIILDERMHGVGTLSFSRTKTRKRLLYALGIIHLGVVFARLGRGNC